MSGNFLSYSEYLASRQQKTSVTSKAGDANGSVAKRAEYPGGKDAMFRYLHTQYIAPKDVITPKAALEAKGRTDSTVKFLRYIKAELNIGADGQVEEVTFVKPSIKPYLNIVATASEKKEFLRVVKQMPRWTPAYQKGAAVASKETVEFATIMNINLPGTEGNEKPNVTQEKSAAAKDLVFIAVEQMPEFPGGMAAMMKYLKENIAYPEDAKRANISGMMVASFVINSEGKVTDVQVLKKLHPSLDQAFVQSLQNMPNWRPGMQNGKAVSVKYTVPYRVVAEAAANGTNEPAYNQEEKVFVAVQQMPEFPGGGQAALMKYLSEKVGLPEEIRKAKVEGMAIASFVVTAEGKITKVEVIKKLHPALDQALEKALQNMPTWVPGKQNGKAVDVKLNLPYKVDLSK
ncbi:TonB family protein [Rufibacter aurantiacus]|uniref:TonB family protein n=1 Tax=Rufibacter aurantiacus TaxID=2817374 RepID=UPI001B305CE1